MTSHNFPAGFIAALTAAVMDRDGTPERDEVRFRCPAPDHPDAHPSARWNPGKGTWFCDICSIGGGALDLGGRLGVEKPRPGGGAGTSSPDPSSAPDLTLERYAGAKRLPVDFLRQLGLSTVPYRGGQAVRIPYPNEDGTTGATRFRTALEKPPTGDRFAWESGSRVRLYGLDRKHEWRAAGFAVGVEGESCAHTAWLLGIPGFGIPGASNWRDDRDAAHLDGVGAIYIVVEPDQGGAALRKKLADSRLRDRTWLIDLSPYGAKDLSDLYLAGPGSCLDRFEEARANATRLAPEPAPEAPQPLGEVHGFLGRFIAYPSPHAHVAHVLWIAHTHLMDAWESTPRLAFLSPEPASGKTRALEITELLVPNPVEAVNVTPAYLFRKVGNDDEKPTILFDEIDTVFGPKAKDNEEIRGLLNAGHRVGAVAGRCVVRGKIVETEEIPAYCAVAMAGLGGLPDTILSRSIVVRMRRRAAGERVGPYRRRVEAPAGHALRERLAAWAGTVRHDVADAWPAMPAGIEDRDSDIWEPLLAVADAAGGDWPARARAAAVALVSESKESTPSLGLRLLSDLRQVFGDRDAMATDDILSSLQRLDEAPWGELVAGKPLNARGLARRLAEYGVKSKQVRDGAVTRKGYARADLWDAWSRYLPPPGPPPQESETSETSGGAEPHKPHGFAGFGNNGAVPDADLEKETPDPEKETCDTQHPYGFGDVSDVSDVSLLRRDELAGEAGADRWTV